MLRADCQRQAGVFVIIHHQHALALHVARQHQLALLTDTLAEACVNQKVLPLRFTVYAHLSTHQFG